MNYNFISQANLLVVEKEERFSLYKIDLRGTAEAVSWAQNQKKIDIYPEYNLLVLQNQIRSFDGSKITDVNHSEIKILPMSKCALIQETRSPQAFDLIVWDGAKIIRRFHDCSDIRYNDEYFAVVQAELSEEGSRWMIYRKNGKLIDCPNAFISNDIRLIGNFLIIDGLGNHSLYWLKKSQLIKDEQQKIVVSPYEDFAMCCSITGKISVFYQNQWRLLEEKADDFGLVADDLGMYYLLKNGKYYIYLFNGKPFLKVLYPDGIDFIGYDEEKMTLMLFSNEKVRFYFP